LAEVDGNRTRRTGIARTARFEGGGAHQVLRHLLAAAMLPGSFEQPASGQVYSVPMPKTGPM